MFIAYIMFDSIDYTELNSIIAADYESIDLLIKNIDTYIMKYSCINTCLHERSSETDKITYIEHISNIYNALQSMSFRLKNKIKIIKASLRYNMKLTNIIAQQRVNELNEKIEKKNFQINTLKKLISIIYKYIMRNYYKPFILKYVSETQIINDKLASVNNAINFVDMRYQNARNNRNQRKYNVNDAIKHKYLKDDIAILITHDNHLNWATTPEYNLACEKRNYIIREALQNKINKLNKPVESNDYEMNLDEIFY